MDVFTLILINVYPMERTLITRPINAVYNPLQPFLLTSTLAMFRIATNVQGWNRKRFLVESMVNADIFILSEIESFLQPGRPSILPSIISIIKEKKKKLTECFRKPELRTSSNNGTGSTPSSANRPTYSTRDNGAKSTFV